MNRTRAECERNEIHVKQVESGNTKWINVNWYLITYRSFVYLLVNIRDSRRLISNIISFYRKRSSIEKYADEFSNCQQSRIPFISAIWSVLGNLLARCTRQSTYVRHGKPRKCIFPSFNDANALRLLCSTAPKYCGLAPFRDECTSRIIDVMLISSFRVLNSLPLCGSRLVISTAFINLSQKPPK